ncbi:aminotransferase class V-fold PLP-dependent enzyme [Amycolatopsis vastitatis]|uniref:Aminotransferase n=1 Tax=Amycolatopsis vastitatis TaxID=1905142 RepID=A0A229T4J2_9PSEU|nr:aminotransferase class V-fold PLP-dependent enzyme [Amycolatopsis vastitatis]OXM65871.1 aminotransferase [Amycolatopsis vastitatis]
MAENALMRKVRQSIIGDDLAMAGPFGRRRVTYADFTASGRAVSFIEDFVRDHVLPWYANTHSDSSATAAQTTALREEARSVIRDAVGGGEDTVVVFTGSGSTGAIDKLITILGLRIPAALADRLAGAIAPEDRPVVFLGPYEHHSNELLWRESICDVVTIPEDADGHVSLPALRDELARHAARPLKIGSFSAASNVTGVLTDTAAITDVLHAHGALAFWDCAAAAPHGGVRMDHGGRSAKDAIFLSPHKFAGGPGTPGVLVVRRELLANRVPSVPGGGTVDYVSATDHHYIGDAAHREEGGTPAIVESVRAGLVFGLQQAVGVEAVREREQAVLRRALASWSAEPNLQVLGNSGADRVAIVSLLVRGPSGKLLHHNYVVALLNDLYGIQVRGGCSCAGPYGHRLLGIGPDRSRRFRDEVLAGREGGKPGWVRISFDYTMSDAVAGYVIEAVRQVAARGWRLLPDYRFDPVTGRWRHHRATEPRLSLSGLRYTADGVRQPPAEDTLPETALPAQLEDADRILGAASGPEPGRAAGGFEDAQWFELPPECVAAAGGS